MVQKANIAPLKIALTKALTEEWKAQGHAMTSSITKNIDYVVEEEVQRLSISGYMYHYGNIIAAGTPSHKVPYSGRSGHGGKSKYITALQNFVKQRMNITDEKKSKSIAFAIATKQKQTGMPTPNSYRFSKNGKRKDWIEYALKSDQIISAMRNYLYDLMTIKIDVLISKWQIELNR